MIVFHGHPSSCFTNNQKYQPHQSCHECLHTPYMPIKYLTLSCQGEDIEVLKNVMMTQGKVRKTASQIPEHPFFTVCCVAALPVTGQGKTTLHTENKCVYVQTHTHTQLFLYLQKVTW